MPSTSCMRSAFDICAAVWPRAPAHVMPSASDTLAGAIARLPAARVRCHSSKPKALFADA